MIFDNKLLFEILVNVIHIYSGGQILQLQSITHNSQWLDNTHNLFSSPAGNKCI